MLVNLINDEEEDDLSSKAYQVKAPFPFSGHLTIFVVFRKYGTSNSGGTD